MGLLALFMGGEATTRSGGQEITNLSGGGISSKVAPMRPCSEGVFIGPEYLRNKPNHLLKDGALIANMWDKEGYIDFGDVLDAQNVAKDAKELEQNSKLFKKAVTTASNSFAAAHKNLVEATDTVAKNHAKQHATSNRSLKNANTLGAWYERQRMEFMVHAAKVAKKQEERKQALAERMQALR